METWMDRMDGRMDGWTDGWVGGWGWKNTTKTEGSEDTLTNMTHAKYKIVDLDVALSKTTSPSCMESSTLCDLFLGFPLWRCHVNANATGDQ